MGAEALLGCVVCVPGVVREAARYVEVRLSGSERGAVEIVRASRLIRKVKFL